MPKISVSLDEDTGSNASNEPEEAAKLQVLAAPLPSISKAKAQSLKDAERVQFAFTNVPKPIKDAFVAEAKRRGLTQKEYLFECLRAGGLDIPDVAKIDARRR